MLRGLVRELFIHQKIKLPLVRAKAAGALAEELIALAQRGDLASRRRILSFLPDKVVVQSLYANLLPRFEGRSGGYARVTKCGSRRGDGSPMAVLEFV